MHTYLPAALPMLAQSSREDASALQHVAAEHGPLSAPHLNNHVANHVLVGVVLWEQELLRSRKSTQTLQWSDTCSCSYLEQGGLCKPSSQQGHA